MYFIVNTCNKRSKMFVHFDHKYKCTKHHVALRKPGKLSLISKKTVFAKERIHTAVYLLK
jgi:hypothetical protein